VAHDLHPEYLSTKYALDLDGVDLVGVQHHHAHIASCLADNGTDDRAGGPVIGVAFDGTGYGTDGTIWGGEFLIATPADFVRAGHLAPVPMPGGAAAIRQPWRMAAAYLDELATVGNTGRTRVAGPAGLAIPPTPAGLAIPVTPADAPGPVRADGPAASLDITGLAVTRRNADRWDTIVAMARRRVNAPLTSSAGRLFDAAAAVLGVRDVITYEGQAAIELEQLADPAETAAYRAAIETNGNGAAATDPAGAGPAGAGPAGAGPAGAGPAGSDPAGGPFLASGADLIGAAVEDLAAGVAREIVAARFHNGLAALIRDGCVLLREQYGLNTVALSGGVFQNLLLLRRTVTGLEGRGFTVLTHSRVPCNDGGISLGQAVVAAARESAD
jgi:hydrogenase maturation protein HypF